MNIEECLFRVVDTETTGLDPAVDKIVELGSCDVYATTALELGGDATRWVQSGAEAWLCNPGIPIPPIAKAVHHIIDSDVAESPPASALIPGLVPTFESQRDYNDGLIFVAHNAKFDRPMLEAVGFPTGRRWLCTHRLAMHVWPGAPSYKNEVLRYWLGYDVLPWRVADEDLAAQAQHRARHDAAVTALILREAFKKLVEHSTLLQLADVDVLIQWAESAVVLKGVCGFGKHFDKTWAEVAQIDAGYLDWMIKQEDREPGSWDLDKIHTARHYRGRLV